MRHEITLTSFDQLKEFFPEEPKVEEEKAQELPPAKPSQPSIPNPTPKLVSVAATWSRCEIQSPRVVPIKESVRRTYAHAMVALRSFPEPDRYSTLRAYGNAIGLHENFTTPKQQRYVDDLLPKNKPPVSNLGRAVGDFLKEVVGSGEIVKYFTPESTIYISSHYQLGIHLPRPDFIDITNNLIAYLSDPQNQEDLINPQGDLTLDALVRAHSYFLNPSA